MSFHFFYTKIITLRRKEDDGMDREREGYVDASHKKKSLPWLLLVATMAFCSEIDTKQNIII